MTGSVSQPDEHPVRRALWDMAALLDIAVPATDYRASDSDREQVTQLLGRAMGDGQIDVYEFERRTKVVYSAETHTELEAVTSDLSVYTLAAPLAVVPGAGPKMLNLFGVFGGFRRHGAWVVPRTLNVFVFCGGGLIDLRSASFVAPDARINVWSLFGRTKVIVPHELDLRIEGVEVMGSFENKSNGPGEPGRPKVLVNGLSIWGSVHVERPYSRGKSMLRRILKGL